MAEMETIAAAVEGLTQHLGLRLSQEVRAVITEFGYSDSEEERKMLPGQLTRRISQLIRSEFPMIFHRGENAYYVYSKSEKVFLEVFRDRLVESCFALFSQAQAEIEAELAMPWTLLMTEASIRKQIKEGLRPNLGVTDGAIQQNTLAFKNAIVDLRCNHRNAPEGKKLLDSPEPDGSIFTTLTISANLVAVSERPPVWDKALRLMGFNTPEMMNALEDILLYLITPSKSREELFYWYGKGSNGKSVLIKFLIEIVGRRHVASISLDELQNSSGGFAWEGLIGKRLNLPAESGSSGFMDSEKLKAIITDDSIAINRKNRPIIDVVLPVKFVFAANRLPVFSEKTHAMYRRFRLVRFDRVVSDDEKVVDFHEVLLAQRDEIVSWWLINHLCRYHVFNPKFELPEIFETWRLETMRGEGDAISAFVEDCLVFLNDPQAEVACVDLLKAFKAYCKDNEINISKWGDTVIYRKLADDFELVTKSNPAAKLAAEGTVVMRREMKNARYYRGLRLIHA